MSDETNEQRSGLSRRDALKRGAAVGGALWVAPLVTAAPAFGAEGSFGDLPLCTYGLWAKYDDADIPVRNGVFDFSGYTDGIPPAGTWDDNRNNGGTPDQDYCVDENTGAQNWAGVGEQPGTVISHSPTEVVETWSATKPGGSTYHFTATITPSSQQVCVTKTVNGSEVPVRVIAALWFQGNRDPKCERLFVPTESNCINWPGELQVPSTPNDISHISFVFCP